MVHKIIGEGSYGCVLKPSIPCKDSVPANFDYSDYVSKFMESDEAKDELNEFAIVGKADTKNEFHLGAPIMCNPDINNPDVIRDVRKCSNLNKKLLLSNPEKFSLLLIKDGGVNLDTFFAGSMLINYLSKNKDGKDIILIEIHRLLRGLMFFQQNGLVHNDIKPSNILFDEKNGEMKYIDFGLMINKSLLEKTSRENTNYSSDYHWSRPIECKFMNKKNYDAYKNFNITKRNEFITAAIEAIVLDKPESKKKIGLKSNYFNSLFSYLDPMEKIPSGLTRMGYVKIAIESFRQAVDKRDYNTNLDAIIDSIDVYAVGFTCVFIINKLKKYNFINLDEYNQLFAFFSKMCSFNMLNRPSDASLITEEYQNILISLGVTTRLKITFDKTNVVKTDNQPKIITEVQKKSNNTPINISKNFKKKANEEEAPKLCPDSKEMNPKTKRCVAKCKEGYARNLDTFKCNKIKTQKVKSVNVKTCPDSKEMNPKTKRCVTKCKEGYARNLDTFKCNKIKTQKVKTVKVKTCPESKDMNPFTNRCISKCKDGYERIIDETNKKMLCKKIKKRK